MGKKKTSTPPKMTTSEAEAMEEGASATPKPSAQTASAGNTSVDEIGEPDVEGQEGELAEDAMMRRDGVSGQLNAQEMAVARRLTREWRPVR